MASYKSTAKRDVYSIITDRITSLLEAGEIPWRRPWAEIAPQNLASGKAYRGINPFLLACSGFGSPFWLTFRQAKALGGHIRKGSKSTPVVFWKVYEKKVEADETGQGDDAEEQTLRLPVLRYYRLFNLEQCEGIPDEKIPSIQARDFHPIEEAEAIVRGMPQAPPIKHGATGAWYDPMADVVRMPDAEYFNPPTAYYSTVYHELVHASGHESRLNRQGSSKARRFGSRDYSQEELVAEMGAAFLCGHCGIEQATIDNSAAYIAGWLKRLKGDRKLVVIAAAQAQKAADFILGLQHEG